jgi:transcriptional regulator GlxA family with amidase domain
VRIDIPVYDGIDEMDALGPLEVLRSAERNGADFRTRLVTRTPQPQVTASYGLRFLPDAVYSPGADLLVVPGGGWAARASDGAWGEVQRGDWLPLLAEASERSAVAGVCSGTMLLAHAGVVGSRRANTHHTAWDDLAATGAQLVTDRVVDDGSLITCGGVSSGIDLALWIVERFAGRELADRTATRMEYARTRPRCRDSRPES